jgi:hypothetical protein
MGLGRSKPDTSSDYKQLPLQEAKTAKTNNKTKPDPYLYNVSKFNNQVRHLDKSSYVYISENMGSRLYQEMADSGYVNVNTTGCNTFSFLHMIADTDISDIHDDTKIISASKAKAIMIKNIVNSLVWKLRDVWYLKKPLENYGLDELTAKEVFARLPGSIIIDMQIPGGILWKRIENPTLRALPLKNIIVLVNGVGSGVKYIPPQEVYKDVVTATEIKQAEKSTE